MVYVVSAPDPLTLAAVSMALCAIAQLDPPVVLPY